MQFVGGVCVEASIKLQLKVLRNCFSGTVPVQCENTLYILSICLYIVTVVQFVKS